MIRAQLVLIERLGLQRYFFDQKPGKCLKLQKRSLRRATVHSVLEGKNRCVFDSLRWNSRENLLIRKAVHRQGAIVVDRAQELSLIYGEKVSAFDLQSDLIRKSCLLRFHVYDPLLEITV